MMDCRTLDVIRFLMATGKIWQAHAPYSNPLFRTC
jgi:hypothetical protein